MAPCSCLVPGMYGDRISRLTGRVSPIDCWSNGGHGRVVSVQKFISNDFIEPPIFLVVLHINVQKISYSAVFSIFLVGPSPKSSSRLSSGRTIDFFLLTINVWLSQKIPVEYSNNSRRIRIFKGEFSKSKI